MFQSASPLRLLAVALTLSMTAGCADLNSASSTAPAPAPKVAATSEPELAGAWYQVYFDNNQTEINARGQMIVKSVAFVTTNNEATRVTVIGKTDRVGNATSNLALSQKRADQVRDALIGAGVPANRIDTSWAGENRQDVATADNEAEQRNRVVDITVIKQPH